MAARKRTARAAAPDKSGIRAVAKAITTKLLLRPGEAAEFTKGLDLLEKLGATPEELRAWALGHLPHTHEQLFSTEFFDRWFEKQRLEAELLATPQDRQSAFVRAGITLGALVSTLEERARVAAGPEAFKRFTTERVVPAWNLAFGDALRMCVECGQVCAPHDRQDRFCSRRCGNRFRKRAFDAKAKRSTRKEPKRDAMDRVSLGAPIDWQPSDADALDDYDADEVLRQVASEFERRGEPHAKSIRALLSRKAVTR